MEFAAAAGAVFLLYLATLAPGVLWLDSGWAQVRTLQRDLVGDLGLALSHPLYYCFTIASEQLIPFGNPAWRVNLVSAVFGALTVANVYLLLRLTCRTVTAPITAALALTVAHTFWQHSVIAEVYTLSLALLSGEWLCLVMFMRGRKIRWLVLLFFVNGLGISNHMLAVLSLAVYGVYLLIVCVRDRLISPLPLCSAAWVAGAALYLGLIVEQIVAGREPSAVIQSALWGKSFARHVSDFQWSVWQPVRSLGYLAINFASPLALLIPVGLWRIRHYLTTPLALSFVAALTIHLLWAVRYNVPDQYVFFLPSIVLLALTIGWGADTLLPRHRAISSTLPIFALTPILVYAGLPSIVNVLDFRIGDSPRVLRMEWRNHILQPWQHGYREPRAFTDRLLRTLPRPAFVFLDSSTVRPVHYRMLRGTWPADVRVYPPLDAMNTDKIKWPEELEAELRRGEVFVVHPTRRGAPVWLVRSKRYKAVPYGPLYRVQVVRDDH